MCIELALFLGEQRGNTARVARAVSMAAGFVSQIADGKREAPPWFVPALVDACGGRVREWHLRPRDWHRIWPTLIESEGALAVPDRAEVLHAA